MFDISKYAPIYENSQEDEDDDDYDDLDEEGKFRGGYTGRPSNTSNILNNSRRPFENNSNINHGFGEDEPVVPGKLSQHRTVYYGD